MKIPEINVDDEQLWHILYFPMTFHFVKAALKYGIFNHLDKPISADGVSKRIQCDARVTTKVLDVLAAMKIITKENNKFFNIPLSETYFKKDSPAYQGDFLVEYPQMYEDALKRLPELMKSGIPKTSEMVVNKEYEIELANSLGHGMLYGAVQKTSKRVFLLPEFPSFKRMLDLGGSSGIFSIAICSEHPSLKAVVFDKPYIISNVTEEFIQKYNMTDRIETLSGDIVSDDIGENYDLVFTYGCLNPIMSDHLHIYMKIYNSLNPGGVFFHHYAEAPKDTAGTINIAVDSAINEFTGITINILREDEHIKIMNEAGFKDVETDFIRGAGGIYEVFIGRK